VTAKLDTASLETLVADLVRIPSVNPEVDRAGGTGEAAVAAFASDWLRERGIAARLQEAAPGRPNVVAEVGDGDGPTLFLCAHLDTVGAGAMALPFEPRVEGRRLHGRGAYDMKASAAAIMGAMVELAAAPLRGSVVAALVADEEHASLGAQVFLAEQATRREPSGRGPASQGCIVTEPSEGRLVLAHKGFAWFEVAVAGRAAHGSRHDLGDSANENAAAFVTAVREHDRSVLRRRTHPLVGSASQHVATIEGGSGWSTYAERCVVRVERRTLPGETGEQALGELRELVAASGARAEVTLVLERPPLECDAESPVARATREAVREVRGSEPEVAGVGYWMDAALFAAAGIPTVDFGPAGAGAHADVEWVDLDSVAETARVLVAAARRFLRQG
jgi:acetylornithine deacetylase